MGSTSFDLPSWICKRDGRLVPFEADKISRSLFAATESLGSPNAFLARELTDSVIHFLQAEADNSIPTTAQVAELVEKVVRELGQPELAQAYAVFRTGRAAAVKTGALIPSDYLKEEEKERTRPQIQPVGPSVGQLRNWLEQEISPNFTIRQAGQACLREFSLREVFTRDLAAACREGLLTVTGLEGPREFYGTSLETFKISNQSILSTLEEAREVTGQFLAIDGLEYAVVSSSQYQKAPAAKVVQEITTALRLTHLQALVNLNCAFPPEWANELAKGPLFSQPDESQNREQIRELGAVVVEEWLQGGTPQAGRIGW
ncbi:MAG TPA: ATP cone domain-containing protein, partial [Gemmataceae bacterium]|nr:ATP cone domain-containing protein [Gemmataceae bacterium]